MTCCDVAQPVWCAVVGHVAQWATMLVGRSNKQLCVDNLAAVYILEHAV